jgi:hypothetical protein
MANPSVTYTFTNGTSADGPEVSQNFTDLINSLTDGTKDITINDLTTNGNTTLGSNSSDTLSVNALVDANFLSDGTATIGTTANPWPSLYLDNAATDGGAIYFDAGSTEYIKANAAGTELDFGGFTTMTFGETTAFNIGDGTDANVTATINADSGDAALVLQVNNAAANAWKIFNDNTNDVLECAYNGNTLFQVDSTNGIATFSDSGGDTLSIDPTSPGATVSTTDNRAHPQSIVKAWAHLDVGNAGAVTVTDGLNTTSAAYAGGSLTVTLGNDMANATYAVMANVSSGAQSTHTPVVVNHAAGTFVIQNHRFSDGNDRTWANGDKVEFIAIGRQ